MPNAFENKYEVIKKIGEGSFSEVLKVEDRISRLQYAAKKLKKRFKSNHDVLYCAEIIATQKLCRHPNVLYMLEHIYDSLGGKVVFIFELMDMSMYEYMKLKKRLSEGKVKIYLYQMLKGLEHLHNNGLFHRDIKPENILVKLPTNNQDSGLFEGELIKLADLGSIRGIYSQPPYTEYISTRWYRSPECLLTMGNYGPKMDIWAVGCVFYEMLTMKPLFPGSNEIDQLSRIHALLGTPSNRLLCKFKNRSKNFENFPYQTGSGLGPLLCNITEDSQHLLKQMLQYDPEGRSNVRRLLENKYFNAMREDDFFRRYKNAEVKTKLIKKGNGDQNYLQYIGSPNSWRSSKFQNTIYGSTYIPPRNGPSAYNQSQQQNTIKEHRSFTNEHAATTGNLRKDYNTSNHNNLPLRPNKHLPPPPPPHLNVQHLSPFQKHQQQPEQEMQQHNYYGTRSRVHDQSPTTDQILLGQSYSGGGGYSYGYGPPGQQGARAPILGKGMRKHMPGTLYSRTNIDLPTTSNHQVQRSTLSHHHQFNTISTMNKQKPSINQQQPPKQQQKSHHNYYNRIMGGAKERDRSRNRKNYNQYMFRDESKGSKGSKNKSNNSSITGISGKGLGGGVSPRKFGKYDKDDDFVGHQRQYRNKQRSKSGQRLIANGGKVLEETQNQHQRYEVGKTASCSPVEIGTGAVKSVISGYGQLNGRQHGDGRHCNDGVGRRNLRKRAASKSPQTTPPKHLGKQNNQRVSSNSYSSGGTVVNINSHWSDVRRQHGECYKPLDVTPLPVCRMNISPGGSYNTLGAVAVGAMKHTIGMDTLGSSMFRKTTSNLPQLTRKPLLPQHSSPYNSSSVKKELQSRSFVLPKRQAGRYKLDTVVELKGRGSRKFK